MITNAQYAITDIRTKIVAAGVGHRTAHLASIGNTTVYLGNSTVTSSNGYAYGKALGEHDVFLGPADELYAVCSSGQTETLTVMVVQ